MPKRKPPAPPHLLSTPTPTPNPPPNPKPTTSTSRSSTTTRRSLSFSVTDKWHPLPLTHADLSLPLTLPTGQSFRWRLTGPHRFTGVVGPHLLSLAHLPPPHHQVSFQLHSPSSFSSSSAAITDYLNVGVSLPDLYRRFSAADARFAEVVEIFGGGGARVLRQDPVECVFQFLCSSNNNIARIEKMVAVLASYGEYLGEVGGYEFHEFPKLERLASVSEQELRDAGFGYRAKYIVGTVKELQKKPGGGEKWLASLRELDLPKVIEALCALPGVGPKVAACIALFSLDQHHAIPVDTHVWKVATRYLMPELADKNLTPKLSNRVSEAFVDKFGKYAGWAQNVLFIGELPAQKILASTDCFVSSQTKSIRRKRQKSSVIPEILAEDG